MPNLDNPFCRRRPLWKNFRKIYHLEIAVDGGESE